MGAVDPPEPSSRARSSLAELDAARLQERFAGLGLTRISAAPERQPVRLVGEIRGHRCSGYDDPPSLSLVIDDGTGTALAVFTGRRRIRGLDAGRTVVVEGVGRRDQRQLVIHNPAYTLLG